MNARQYLLAGLLVGLVTLLAAAGVVSLAMPEPRPEQGAAESFSAGRALALLRVLAADPRPIGSPAAGRARDAIVAELDRLQLAPRGQAAAVSPRNGRVAGTVRNVVARLPGRDPSRAVLLVAHYDSVPVAPGAADNGGGVATLLETARALRAGEQLRNDVVFLFTDGEARGLLGSRAFVRDHPWAYGAGLVLNFGSVGSSTPALMYETSPGNGRLVREYLAAARRPSASSLMYEVARRESSKTDFRPFIAAGVPGLNLGALDGPAYYHTGYDEVARLSARSLQHQGDTALALARHFGGLELWDLHRPDVVYFTMPGGLSLVYGERMVAPFVGLAAALLAAAVAAAACSLRGGSAGRCREPRESSPRASWSWPWCGACTAPPTRSAPGPTRGGGHQRPLPHRPHAARRRCHRRAVLAPDAPPAPVGARAALIALAGALPGLVLMSSAVHLLLMSAGLKQVVTVVAVWLVAGLLVVPLEVVRRGFRLWLPAALAAAGIIVLMVVGSGVAENAEHPRFTSVHYRVGRSGIARWQTTDPLDAWTRSFLRADLRQPFESSYFPQLGMRQTLTAAAPQLRLPPPEIRVLADAVAGGRRTVRLLVRSPRGAPVVSLLVHSVVGRLTAEVDGMPLRGKDTTILDGTTVRWSFDYYAAPPEGVTVTLRFAAGPQVLLRAVDFSDGIPSELEARYPERPGDMLPARIGDGTLAEATLRLPAVP